MQTLIVTLIVAYAFWVVAKRYAPGFIKQFIHSVTVRTTKRLGLNRLANKLESEELKRSTSSTGCGKCGGCSTNAVASTLKNIPIRVEAVQHMIKR